MSLLNLFPQFRSLERECQELHSQLLSESSQRLSLQDRLDAALDDRGRLWDLLSKSIDDMKLSYQMHINAQWQRQGFGTPYPEAPHIERGAEPRTQESISRRELPSEKIARKTNETLQHLAGTLK